MWTTILFWSVALSLSAGAVAFVLPGLMRSGSSRRWLAGLLIAAAVPLLAAALYLYFGTPQAVDGSSPDLAPTSASDYVERLESHLQRQPRDARGWVLLGRAHLQAERFDAAVRAFERAVAVSPDKVGKDPAVLCEYADAVAMTQGGQLRGKPAELVAQALALNSRHPVALEMAGSAAYEGGQYAEAIAHWSLLLEQIRADTPRHKELTDAVARARMQAAVSDKR